MDNIEKILESIETELNQGIDITKRLTLKSFNLFKNPVFLMTFFTIMFAILGYKLSHYFKQKNDTLCPNFKSEKDCPEYCVWDNETCETPLKSGNACPDYWKTTVDPKNKNIYCTNTNKLKVKDECYTNKSKKEIKITNNKLSNGWSKCEWIHQCGPWENQASSKFGCHQDISSTNPFKTWK